MLFQSTESFQTLILPPKILVIVSDFVPFIQPYKSSTSSDKSSIKALLETGLTMIKGVKGTTILITHNTECFLCCKHYAKVEHMHYFLMFIFHF